MTPAQHTSKWLTGALLVAFAACASPASSPATGGADPSGDDSSGRPRGTGGGSPGGGGSGGEPGRPADAAPSPGEPADAARAGSGGASADASMGAGARDGAGSDARPATIADAGALGDLAPASGRVSCKRGVAYGRHSVADMQALSRGVGWWYNWTTRPDSGIGDAYRRLGVEYVPMIWGGRFNVDEAVAAIPTDAKYLLGFNEPNFGTQANLTPAQAAMLWPRVEEIARRRNLKIVSPATNYCGTSCLDTDPFRWMDQFIAACPACQFDYVATHMYTCYGAGLRGHLTKLKKYGKPIWVTEFSCASDATPNVANQTRYMKEAVTLLESDPDVFRYSWFTGRTTSIAGASLLDAASGVLTPLGEQYVTLPFTTGCMR